MTDRAMELVMDAGKTLLENGGEVFRAQSTMEIMAHSLGVRDFHVYVLTNGIFASAEGPEGTVSAVRHIPRIHIHLGRVEAVNELSRELAEGGLDLPGAEAALARARALPDYGPRISLLAGAVGSACFGYLFGGAGPEILTAFAAGALEMIVLRLFGKAGVSKVFTDIAAAACCTALALAMRGVWGVGYDPGGAIIGALMVLTPGVALTMAIRDLINADYLSGTIRLFDALLVAGCLACGVALTYIIANSFWGVPF